MTDLNRAWQFFIFLAGLFTILMPAVLCFIFSWGW